MKLQFRMMRALSSVPHYSILLCFTQRASDYEISAAKEIRMEMSFPEIHSNRNITQCQSMFNWSIDRSIQIFSCLLLIALRWSFLFIHNWNDRVTLADDIWFELGFEFGRTNDREIERANATNWILPFEIGWAVVEFQGKHKITISNVSAHNADSCCHHRRRCCCCFSVHQLRIFSE